MVDPTGARERDPASTLRPRTITTVTSHERIDGVVPGVRGQRAFPTRARRIVDPFVMLDHIGPERVGSDFFVDGHMHPHRGFETLTIMFEGVMYHVDSAGYRETLETGSTQNMIAGSGIQHGGSMAADPETNVFHEVQLWVNMPAAAKMNPPEVHSAHLGDKPLVDRGHYSLEVIAGTLGGHTSPLSTTQPTTVARVRTSDVGPIRITGIDRDWNALCYVLQGSIDIAGQRTSAYQTVVFDSDGEVFELESTGPEADVLFVAGEPIGEPVAMGGPFVMNTSAEIARAEADYSAGLFDNVSLAAETTVSVRCSRIQEHRTAR